MSRSVVGQPVYTQNDMSKWVTVKKLLVSAIFNPEYSEFFIDRFYNNIIGLIQRSEDSTLRVPEGTVPSEFTFNDINKELYLTLNFPNYTEYVCQTTIRSAFAQTISDIISNGRMCDILYLINAEGYNTLSNWIKMENSVYYSRSIADMFNINSFGNSRYILSLIQ